MIIRLSHGGVFMNRKTFGFLIILATLLTPLALADSIRCESDYNRRHDCTFSGWGRIALSHQLSKTACIEAYMGSERA
jgi:hypothetical protein